MPTSQVDFGICLQQLPWTPIRERTVRGKIGLPFDLADRPFRGLQ
jgi:hypothetical protein